MTPVLLAKMDQNFDRPILALFDEPWVGVCPACWKLAGEALVLLVWALKRMKILIKFDYPGPVGQNEPNFLSAYFPLIWVGGLPYMLETCRGGPGPISLSVEKTKNFDQVRWPRSCWPKWTKILIGLF